MEIAQLKELRDHTVKETLQFLRTHSLEVDNTVNWLNEHGGYCDCEVIDIVGWHLEKEANPHIS